MIIDTKFRMFSDTPSGKDPDKFSPTLREYHRQLWSKPLPDGTQFTLTDNQPKTYLYHQSALGAFHLGSDAFSNTYRDVERMKPITSSIPTDAMTEFYNLCSTIGAYVIFPAKMIDKKQTINMARGCHPKIRDRIDLTLECVRRHYADQPSPLSDVLNRYCDFFALFQSFESYVDFFLLNDLVDNGAIKFFLLFENFQRDGFPKNLTEYQALMSCTAEFVNKRNERINQI